MKSFDEMTKRYLAMFTTSVVKWSNEAIEYDDYKKSNLSKEQDKLLNGVFVYKEFDTHDEAFEFLKKVDACNMRIYDSETKKLTTYNI
jgi:hypothetical protein